MEKQQTKTAIISSSLSIAIRDMQATLQQAAQSHAVIPAAHAAAGDACDASLCSGGNWCRSKNQNFARGAYALPPRATRTTF